MRLDPAGGLFWSPGNAAGIFAHFPTFENERIKAAADQRMQAGLNRRPFKADPARFLLHD